MTTPPSVFHDLTLSSVARLELEVQLLVLKGTNIVGKAAAHRWANDTVVIDLDYDYNIIAPNDGPSLSDAPMYKNKSQLPQTSVALPTLKLTSAKLFIPPNVSATYIGQ